jgi:hypothetical protein
MFIEVFKCNIGVLQYITNSQLLFVNAKCGYCIQDNVRNMKLQLSNRATNIFIKKINIVKNIKSMPRLRMMMSMSKSNPFKYQKCKT